MRFKKPRGVLLGIGFGAMIIAAALFFLVPIICGEGFQYTGAQALLAGITGLFTFNFANVLYTAVIVLFVVAVALLIVFVVLLSKKKHAKHLVTWFFTVVCIFASYVLVSAYFLGADITFNSAVTSFSNGSLLDLMMKAEGQMLGKILSSVALAFGILSNILLIVHIFVCMVAMMVTDQMKDFEEKVSAEKEEEVKAQVAEIVASAPAVEKAPEEVIVESVDETIARLQAEGDFEERKARELKIFKECVDSGYFTEYEEIELPKPLEGFDEEPVCEASVVEEKSSMVRRSSVYVGFTHN